MRTAPFLFGLAIVFFFNACGDDTPSQAHEDDTPIQSSSSINEESSASISSSSSPNGNSNSEISSSAVSSSESTPNSSATPPESSGDVKYAANYNPETGLLTDERDGEIYKTAEIGEQIWMAENLRYTPQPSDSCFLCASITEDSAVWAQYGHHHSWLSSLALPSMYENHFAFFGDDPAYNSPHQGLCPKGWHIPSFDEWNTLIEEVQDIKKLLSTSWSYSQTKGTDEYGFNLLPHQPDENVDSFIMIDEVSEERCNTIVFENYTNGVAIRTSTTWKWVSGMYVRCLMDEPHPTHVIYE